MSRCALQWIAVFWVVLFSLSFEASAATYYVDLNGSNPTSPYIDWSTAATNIQDAIDVSVDGDLILVTNGVYQTGGRVVYGSLLNRVVVGKAVTIQSVNGPALTVIQGNPLVGNVAVRCVYLTNNAMLAGFTLTNGATRTFPADLIKEECGGGVWCEDQSATISNCVFAGNTAVIYGGGAYQGTLLNCILTNNTASQGGGAYSNRLINCTLLRNAATEGGTSLAGGGAMLATLSNCWIIANHAPSGGGGAAASTLIACVISNNTAGFGGGVCVGVANNCLISSNRVSGAGGGAYSNTLNNCVVKRNLAGSNGGGIYGSALGNCTVVSNTSAISGGGAQNGSLTNCIIYYNSGSGSPNTQDSSLRNCDTIPSAPGLGNISNPPAFVSLAGNDFRLQSNSPCINAGNNAYVSTAADLDGNPRVAGGTVDIGAYEYQAPASVLSYAWAQQYGLPTDGTADNADTDGDGMSNWQEWRTGTVPTNAASILKLASPHLTNSPAGLVVSWQSVSGVVYLLQSSTSLVAQPPFSTIQSNIAGQAGTTSYRDTNATNGGPYFYRIGVQ